MYGDGKKNRRHVLITGGSGYIGSHVAHACVEKGWCVNLLVRPESNLVLVESIKSQVTVSVHDGSTESLLGILKQNKPDVVMHLAAQGGAEHKPSDVASLIQANVLFGTQLLEAMSACEVNCFINTGTYWQYYNDSDYDPVSLYAATKQAFEDILAFYVRCRNFRAITLTLFDIYGPNDPRSKLLNHLASMLSQPNCARNMVALSPGEQFVDLVHVDDVVAAYLRAANLVEAQPIGVHSHYSVSSGNPISLKDVIRHLEEVAGESLPIEWGGKPYRPREVMRPWSRGDALPDWKPIVKLNEGLASLLTAVPPVVE